MEYTTLQQRIEERAKSQLLKDLKIATDKQADIISLVGKDNFPEILGFRERYDSYQVPRTQIVFTNDEKNNKIFNELLPLYITRVTDELLGKVDEIEWLLKNKEDNLD